MIDTSTLQPGDEFDWLLEWRSLTNGGEPVTTVKDLLPSQFELVTEEAPCLDVIGTWDPDPAACSSSATTPAYTTEDVSGGTLITFKDIDLPALGSTSWNAQFDHKFVIRLHVRVKDGTPVKTYTNTMSVIPEGYVPVCNWGSTAVDSYGGCPADDSVEVVAAAAVGLQKWDKGVEENVSQTTGKASSSCPNWNGFTRYPCVAQTLPGGDLTYRLKLSNQGNQTLTNEVVYDVLPYIGDTGVSDALDDQSRGTEWSPVLTGPITVDASLTTATNANAVVEYNLTTNPCRPELKAGSADGDWQASCDDTWYAASDITDWSTVRSFRVTAFQSGAQWAPGDRVVLTVPMKAPANAPTSTITKSGVDLSVAWNSAAQRAYRVESDGSTTRMQATEPRKVGVIIPAPYVSIGDYVWYDANYNGKQDDGEKPAAGVQVTLKDASGNVVGTTTTDSDGYYWFQNLTEKTAYTLTFAKPDGYGWTIQNAGTDDAIDSDVDPSTSTISFTSPAWVENVSHNLGGHDVADDTTLDAGLVAPRPLVSVGDYVWYDTNRDGLQTSGEKPVKDVTVNLYDADNKLVDTTKTDDSGHYWFTNLVSGNQYTIGFVKPDGTVFTTPDAGNDVSNSATTDLTDSDAPANGKVTFVAEASGANLGGADKADNPGIDAGLLSYNLVLDKSLDTTGTVRIGDDVTYTLSPSNEGPVNALAGWSVTDVLPAGLTLKSMSGTGYTCDLATATCTSSSPLGVGKGQPITVVATVGAGTSGSLKNVAYVAPIASDTVSETNPLSTPPTVATDTRTSPTDNDAQAAVTVSPLVSIGDYVWWDNNRDGLQTPGEPVYSGMTVELLDASGHPVASTTTDADGYYAFANLDASTTYQVKFVTGDGEHLTIPAAGTATLDSNPDPATGVATVLTPATGANQIGHGQADNPTVDAGVYQYNLKLSKSLASAGPFRDGGTVRFELTPSNTGPSTALAGWSVTDLLPTGLTLVSMTGDGYTCTADTCTAGSALAAGASGKAITVEATISATFSGTAHNVAYVTPAASDGAETNPLVKPTRDTTDTASTATDNDAQADVTVPALVSVGDYVWFDANHDGVQDSTEKGIAGVSLTLTGPDGKPVTDAFGNPVGPTVTDEHGKYSFVDLPVLPAGASYTVAVTAPAGFIPTVPGVGGRATDSSTGSASSTGLTANKDSDNTLDFGFWNAEPAIGIVKKDAAGNDADTAGTKVTLNDGSTGLVFTITNPGNETLTRIVVTDTTTGSGTVSGISCAFPDGSTGTTWDGPFLAGASFVCTAQLTGVTADLHSDTAAVSGVGAYSGTSVTGSNPYNAVGPTATDDANGDQGDGDDDSGSTTVNTGIPGTGGISPALVVLGSLVLAAGLAVGVVIVRRRGSKG